MTPSEQRRYNTLLEIARYAQRAANITTRFNMRAMPRRAVGGLTLERSEIIVHQWQDAMEDLAQSLTDLNLDDMELSALPDDPVRQPLVQAVSRGGGRVRVNLRPRR